MQSPLSLVRSVKSAWHRDLAATPETHAWVLNLYRAGEKHPQTVLDYFPADYAPVPELAALLIRHREDELRHTRMYGRAIEALGQPIEELAGLDVFNNAIRKFTPASFFIEPRVSDDEKADKVAHFLAHAHHLERRIAASLEHHVEACAALGRDRVATVVEVVLADEHRHVAYTREMVFAVVPARRARDIMAIHARGESRAHRVFSARQVRAFLARFPGRGAQYRRAAYALGALLMQGGLVDG